VNRPQLEALLADVAAGRLAPEAALERLAHFPFEELSFAKVDHHRALRQGLPEVVYCEGKAPEQVIAILERLQQADGGFLGTRISEDQARQVIARFPKARWNHLARTVVLPAEPAKPAIGSPLLVVSAGNQRFTRG
jgi:NCAIR mutase (PurE)-related protein